MTAATRSRAPLLGLAALFLAPLAVAFWLYYGTGWRPGGSTNHGELFQPTRPLPAQALVPLEGGAARDALHAGKWSLVYLGAGACDEQCRTTLIFARQVHLAMGRLADRVQRVFLATGACCDRDWLPREQTGLIVQPVDGAPALQQQFPADGRARGLFIVDPLGNLVMRYDAQADPKGLRDDLKKLLDLSHIG